MLQLFIAHGNRPTAGASARAPQERRAAVAACREPVEDGLALTREGAGGGGALVQAAQGA